MNMSNKKIKIDVLYEDVDCAVLNKPAGIMVHSDGKTEGEFLTDWIAEKYPESKDVGDPMTDMKGQSINRAGIVHRLDRETSGALLIARTSKGHEMLKKQFQDRTISKKYLAFVWGELKEEFGTIDRPIGRSTSDFRRYTSGRGIRGETRDAKTYWTKIFSTSIPVNGKQEKISLVEVEPKTGRTHQIRVHMNETNHPVVGDVLYAPKRPSILGFERTALHARSIEFLNPALKKIKVVAPLPADFEAAYGILGINVDK